MSKDFKRWHEEKTRINNAEGSALFHEREVWWCSLGENVGYEQDGGSEQFTRPVVILTKFNLYACLVVPLTARTKKGKYYFHVGKIEGRDAVAVLSQIRFVDRKRLALKITMIDRNAFKMLTQAIVKECFHNVKL